MTCATSRWLLDAGSMGQVGIGAHRGFVGDGTLAPPPCGTNSGIGCNGLLSEDVQVKSSLRGAASLADPACRVSYHEAQGTADARRSTRDSASRRREGGFDPDRAGRPRGSQPSSGSPALPGELGRLDRLRRDDRSGRSLGNDHRHHRLELRLPSTEAATMIDWLAFVVAVRLAEISGVTASEDTVLSFLRKPFVRPPRRAL